MTIQSATRTNPHHSILLSFRLAISSHCTGYVSDILVGFGVCFLPSLRSVPGCGWMWPASSAVTVLRVRPVMQYQLLYDLQYPMHCRPLCDLRSLMQYRCALVFGLLSAGTGGPRLATLPKLILFLRTLFFLPCLVHAVTLTAGQMFSRSFLTPPIYPALCHQAHRQT